MSFKPLSSKYDEQSSPRLPTELQIRVISHLDYNSLDNVGQVCRAWRFISSDQNMWRTQMQASFGIPKHSLGTEQSSASWRRTVKKAHHLYKSLSNAKKLHLSLQNGHFVLAARLAESLPSLLTDDVLYTACSEGHLQVASLAIQWGFDVNHLNKSDGSSLLYIAAQEGHLEVVQLLVFHGADLEFKFTDGYSPLFIASQNNRLNVVKYLLRAGADINAACSNGSTPLYIACQQGHIDVVKTLVISGASAELLHKNFSCLYVAARNGYDEVLAFLLTRFHHMIEVLGGDDSPILYTAAQNGHAKCVQLLVDAHANPEVTFLNTYRPLYIAAQGGHVDVVEVLCRAGAVLDVYNNTSTALYVAAQNGYLAVVKSLLTHGASVNIATHMNRYTPLYIAANQNQLAVCEMLLDHGAEIDLVFDLPATPLHVASSKGHVEVVKLLLRRGASINGIVNSDKVPLHAAMCGHHLSTIQVLIDSGADTEGVKEVACTRATLAYTCSLIPGMKQKEEEDSGCVVM